MQVNEMHLLMAFNSPYVIRAYRCLTYKRILAPTLTERNDSITIGTRDSMDTSIDGFGGAPTNGASSVAAATAASNSGGKRGGSSSSFERTRSNSGGTSSIINLVKTQALRKSGDAAASMQTASTGSAELSSPQANAQQQQQQGTPTSLGVAKPLIHVRSSSSSLHVTPNGGRAASNNSNSVQMTPGGTNPQTSRSSGGMQRSRNSQEVPEGVHMLATWLVQVRAKCYCCYC
jgi:hypothetical protein